MPTTIKQPIIATIADLSYPLNLSVEPTVSLDKMIQAASAETMFGGARIFFGTAYVQGNRIMFTTAMPVEDLMQIAKIDRSSKRSGVEAVMEHSNRPEEVTHGKNLKKYFLETACVGEKWIVPSLTLNCGVGATSDDPQVKLILVTHNPNATVWPAVLIVPLQVRCDVTDGAHRGRSIDQILSDLKLSQEQRDRLRANGLSVNFVFESDQASSHQDFADCGKAKTIAPSMIVTWDVRDVRNRRTRDLVRSVAFLSHHVDATASNVNLSGKSLRVWSMSAMRLFTTHVAENHPQVDASLDAKMADAEAFFAELIKHIPVLRALDPANLQPGEKLPSTGELRENRGGNLVLRGVGLAIFAHAFLSAKVFNISFEDMAKALGTVDWHVLTIAKPPTTDPDFREKVDENRSPLFDHMVSVTETRMKISSSAADAGSAWAKIVASIPALADVMLEEVEIAA